jgi:hypothetical protein
LIFGLINLRRVLHIGSNIIAPSTDRAKPAPRDSHTEYVNVLRPASLGSSCCFFLYESSASGALHANFIAAFSPSKYKQPNVASMEYDVKQKLRTPEVLLDLFHKTHDVVIPTALVFC